MKTCKPVIFRSLVGLAVLAAFAPAHGQGVTNSGVGLVLPQNSVRLGAGVATGDPSDRSIFGQYNGLRDQDGHLLLDFDYTKRNDATGTWAIMRGRNLGLDNRELSVTTERQGDWRFSADYSELVHHEIRTINTGLLGPGTPAPQVILLPAPGAGLDQNLSVQRKGLGLSGSKWFTSNWQFEVNFKNEDKTGARFWGRGYDCASTVCATGGAGRTAILMLPEPINSNIKLIDAKLNYHTGKLLLSGGYYGSFYTNYNGNLTATVPPVLNAGPLNGAAAGGTSLQNVLQTPMALWPDNQAHQLYIDGNYAFSPKVSSNFKLARTHATQNEDFGGMGFVSGINAPPPGVANLGGVFDTTLAQLGLSANPAQKLSLLGNVRFEDRSDKTPIEYYNIEGANTFTNGNTSLRKLNAKAQASYLFPAMTHGTVGVDYDVIDRGAIVQTDAIAGLTGLREKTWETTLRGELRRAVAENLTGSIGASHGVRNGSIWLKPNPTTGVTTSTTGVTPMSDDQIYNRTGIFPYTMTDRVRDAARATAEWMATERLNFTLVGQGTRDHYGSPSEKGLLRGGSRLWSIDGAYAMSENWKLTAYASWGDQSINVAHSTSYIADIHDTNKAFGLGVVGKPRERLEVGGKLSYLTDTTRYGLGPDRLSSANNVNQLAIGLPDVKYRETRLNLYGNYAVQKNGTVRLDVIRYVAKLDEWAWGDTVPWTYWDNTTVSINPDQRVTFVGASYIYKF